MECRRILLLLLLSFFLIFYFLVCPSFLEACGNVVVCSFKSKSHGPLPPSIDKCRRFSVSLIGEKVGPCCTIINTPGKQSFMKSRHCWNWVRSFHRCHSAKRTGPEVTRNTKRKTHIDKRTFFTGLFWQRITKIKFPFLSWVYRNTAVCTNEVG